MANRRRLLDRVLGHYKQSRAHRDRDKVELADTVSALAAVEEALRVLQAVAQGVQESAHARVAGLVTRCLQVVFVDAGDYEFAVRFDKKRGKTEARFVLVRDGVDLDPLTAAGGGVVDVVSFALRLCCVLLARPARRRLLVLDEPLKHLSACYRPNARALLEGLAKDLDVQIILVTHSPEFEVGEVIRLEGQ